MARELSQAGFEVLVLEQGPRYTAADFRHDELDYWFNGGITNKLDTNPQTFRKSADEQVAQRVQGFPAAWYAPMVGGSSIHFTGNFWRFHEVDFKERSAARRDSRHDVSPTGRSTMRSSSRITRKSTGRSASRDSPARARSIRRAASRIRCRRCR